MPNSDDFIDRALDLTERVVQALGQHKGYIELQNKDMEKNFSLVQEVDKKQDAIISNLLEIKGAVTSLNDRQINIEEKMKKLEEKDERLKKIFGWAVMIASTVGSALGGLFAFLTKVKGD